MRASASQAPEFKAFLNTWVSTHSFIRSFTHSEGHCGAQADLEFLQLSSLLQGPGQLSRAVRLQGSHFTLTQAADMEEAVKGWTNEVALKSSCTAACRYFLLEKSFVLNSQ